MKDRTNLLWIAIVALIGAMVMLFLQFKKLQKPKLKGVIPDQVAPIKTDIYNNVISSDAVQPHRFSDDSDY